MQPSVFIGHGSPTKIIENDKYRQNLLRFAKSIDQPDAIVVLSAHWQEHKPIEISSAEKPGIIYDYYGFPEEMYSIKYDVSGSPVVAGKVKKIFDNHNLDSILNPKQGLDHGAWIPIAIMYPQPTVPVLQVSIPHPHSPEDLYRLGSSLSALRKQNVMIMGSGNITHNLGFVQQSMRRYGWDDIPRESWAINFDEWIKNGINGQEYQNIVNSSYDRPEIGLVAPTTEHLDPLFFTLGASMRGEGFRTIHEGVEMGSISMRCIASEL